MKLSTIAESNILYPGDDLIDSVLALIGDDDADGCEAQEANGDFEDGMCFLGNADDNALPIYAVTPYFMDTNSIPMHAAAAYMPHNKLSDHAVWEHLPQGLYLFPSFYRMPLPIKRKVIMHELVHYIDPKVELVQHQKITRDPWESEPEQDAMLTPAVVEVVQRFKNGDQQVKDDILDDMRAGNVPKLIDSFPIRGAKEWEIPQKFHKRFLTKLFSAIRGDRAI
jgi:hypothetical protein